MAHMTTSQREHPLNSVRCARHARCRPVGSRGALSACVECMHSASVRLCTSQETRHSHSCLHIPISLGPPILHFSSLTQSPSVCCFFIHTAPSSWLILLMSSHLRTSHIFSCIIHPPSHRVRPIGPIHSIAPPYTS